MKAVIILMVAVMLSAGCSRGPFFIRQAKDSRFDDLNNRVSLLESQFESNTAVLNTLTAQVDSLNALIDALQAADLGFSGTDNALQASLAALQASLNALQLAQNEVVADLAELQTHEGVVEFVDPCGDGPGFDEVLVRTSSGKLVAYFETGGHRFLSLLSAGNYRTTDTQHCNFTVNGSGQIVNEHL